MKCKVNGVALIIINKNKNNTTAKLMLNMLGLSFFLDLCIIVITELEVRVQVPSLREGCPEVSDRGGHNSVSVVPV